MLGYVTWEVGKDGFGSNVLHWVRLCHAELYVMCNVVRY